MAADAALAETIRHARRLLQDDKEAENLAFLEKAIERFPDDPEVRLLYGTALVPLRPEDAPWQIATAVSLSPDDPALLTRAASLLLHLGEVEAARSYAARASTIAPPDFIFQADLLYLGGKLAALSGDRDLAEEALQEAVAIDPSSSIFLAELVRFVAEDGRQDEARELIDSHLSGVDDKQRLTALRAELERGRA